MAVSVRFNLLAISIQCIALKAVAALPSSAYSSYPPYVPPGAGDVRSPCPGLNSLANHGFIPHSGKGNTLPILLKGLADGLNVGADFTTAIGTLGILSNPQQPATSFDLDMLDEHNFPIEHDASLSRNDAYFGDDHTFNQTLFNSVLAYFPSGGQGNVDFTIPQASKARYNRVTTENGRDPTFTYLPNTIVLSYGETALYLSTMGDPITGIAPGQYVRSLFEQERLPYELGWTKPLLPTTLASLALMVAQELLATGEPLPEGLVITESALSLAFSGFDPITGQKIGATKKG